MFKLTSLKLVVLAAAIFLSAPMTVFGDCCTVPDNGSGTADLPPEGCDYASYEENWAIIGGSLPPGTTIEGPGTLNNFFNIVRMPGGTLGGEVEFFNSTLTLELVGTGDLTGYNRTLVMEVGCEVHTGPRNPGDPVQTFPQEFIQLQGQISGDPDFESLILTGGLAFGMPSPGQTTLTQLPSGDFAVDSFFDIMYRIDFVGAAGGPLEGFLGLTTGTVRMRTESDCHKCTDPDNAGTIDFPAPCEYDNDTQTFVITEGLPPGDKLILDGYLGDFWGVEHKSGTVSGGETVFFNGSFEFDVSAIGTFAGFSRHLMIPVIVEVHTTPRNPGDPVQTFAADMFRLSGEIAGDPDFDLLRITAGTGNGLPCPGKTILEELPSGDFAVDSFFDITYEIEFEGALGSIFDGMSGTTTSSITLFTGYFYKTYIAADNDYWATSEAVIEFGSSEVPPIPAGFFGPGSDPFEGQVCLRGEPLGPTAFGEYCEADTLILRDSDVVFEQPYTPADLGTVDIEIVALNLVSCEPIEVSSGPTDYYDLRVTLDPALSSSGTMSIQGQPTGGTYQSTFMLYPRFIFTPVAGGPDLILDPSSPITVTSPNCTWQNTTPIPSVRPIDGFGQFYRGPRNPGDPVPVHGYGDFFTGLRSSDDPVVLQFGPDSGSQSMTNDDPLPMDFNSDGKVNFEDYASFASKWLFCQ